jgi:precorrin-2/cobalt-factor-2 C20-methyltransferase
MANAGTLYGVGIGPGDPELITRKAARILAEVDWIYLPAGTTGASFAARILAPLDLPGEKIRRVSLCMSRDRRADGEAYRRVAAEIAAELRRGRSAAWATEGDPLFYSTFLHLHEEMRRGFPDVMVEVVPGVTSVHAAAARAAVPVAHLDEMTAVLPAAYGLERLPALLAQFPTVFLLKVHSVFDQLLERLGQLPGPVQAFYLEKVGTAEERVVTDLPSLRGQKLPYFSLVILRQEGRAGSEGRGA